MGFVRYVGVPRAELNAIVAEQAGWKHLGQRILARAMELCPVGAEGDDYVGPHLKDTLVVSFISGADPRILVGSKTKGGVLGFVLRGTDPHDIFPVNASALRFVSGGVTVFAAHVSHPGTKPNDFVLAAARGVAQEAVA